ncbi:MAG TPA: hypothetical protein PKO28_03815 [Bacilli bacterium]|nr:hypothetical protein [Bacilli bacterium]HPS18657.1 hypothetical protein [Bacilli bacterium]
MNAKTKKILLVVGIVLDIAITAFLLVVSIIMLATMPATASEIDASTFIGYLQANPTVYLLSCVIPLFVLLALNITALVWYVKKVANKKVALSDLNEEQKEALRKQLLAEMNKKPEDKSPEA